MKISSKKIITWLSISAIIMSLIFTAFAEGEDQLGTGSEDVNTVSTQVTDPEPTEPDTTPDPNNTQDPGPSQDITQDPSQDITQAPTTPQQPSFDPYTKVSYTVSTNIFQAILPSEGKTQTVNVTVNVKALDPLTPIRDITLYIGGSEIPVTETFTQPISADNLEGINIVFPVYLNDWDIGIDIPVYAQYTCDVVDDANNLVTVTVGRHSAGTFKVELAQEKYTVVLTADKAIVPKGEAILYTLALTNNTPDFTPLGSIVSFYGAYDNGAEQIFAPIDVSGIASGETKTFTFEFRNAIDSITLTPTLTVLDEVFPDEPLYIELKNTSAQIILDVVGVPGATLEGKVTIKYTVINNGNVKLKNIKVYDDNTYTEKHFPVTELEPGQKVCASTRVQITKDTTVRYRVIAQDEFGEQVKRTSNEKALSLIVSDDDIIMTVVAVAKNSTEIYKAQDVLFDVAITNNSGITVNNITVYDLYGNMVWTVPMLLSNEHIEIPLPVYIQSSENVYFTVVVAYQDDSKVSFESNLVPINLVGTTPKPTDSATEAPQITTQPTLAPSQEATQTIGAQNPDNSSREMLELALYIVAGLIIVGIIALIIMSSVQKRAARKRRKITRRVR